MPHKSETRAAETNNNTTHSKLGSLGGLGHHNKSTKHTDSNEPAHLNNATNNYMNPMHKGAAHGVTTADAYAAPLPSQGVNHITAPAAEPMHSTTTTMPVTSSHNMGTSTTPLMNDTTTSSTTATRTAGPDASILNSAAPLQSNMDTRFNPDSSLRNNDFNVEQDFSRLQGVTMGGVSDTTTTGHHHHHHDKTGMATGAGLTGAGVAGTHHHGLDRNLDNTHTTRTGDFTRDAHVAGSDLTTDKHHGLGHDNTLHNNETKHMGTTGTGVATGAGLGAAATGATMAGAHHHHTTPATTSTTGVTDRSHLTGTSTTGTTGVNSQYSNASTNSKGEHSTFHGQTTSLTGSIKESMGKMLKKPAMAEAGSEQKLAGQEEVALAKEEKSAEKAHKKH